MKYIINDDDLEYWHKLLKPLAEKYADHSLMFICEEMEEYMKEHYGESKTDQ